MTEQEALKDFFISYNRADRAWAEWVAWQLEAEGYTVVLQAWDFRPGGNFILQMNEAVLNSKRTIAILSPDYLDLKAVFSHLEWAATLVQDPEGQKARLLPIRVRECTPAGLLATISFIDLVELSAEEARNELLAGVRRSRNLPSLEPLYPGHAPQKRAQIPDFPGDWPAIWNVPHDRNPFFTGRDDLLLRLHDALLSAKPAASIQIRALSGLGGIGKTQTALEYAHRYGHEYRCVLWVNAVTIETLASDMVQLATVLQLPEDGARDQQKTIEAIKRWLSRQRDWLLILDNADDLTLAARFLPQGARTNGHVLLTTRASAGGALAQMIEVEKMNNDEGTLFLLRRLITLPPDALLEQVNSPYRSDVEAIVRLLDGLPLAIDQAGAYIEEMATTPAAYLRLYRIRRADLLKRRGQFPPGHPETVATTWSLSFQQVERVNPLAADLLRLLSFLAPDAVSESLITTGVSAGGDEVITAFADEYSLNEAIEVLRKFSLVRRSPETRVISIHRLVQVMLKDILDDAVKKQWAIRVVVIVNAALPRVNFQRFDLYQEYFPHAQVATDLISSYQLSFLEAAQLLYKVGWYSREQGKYEQAEPLYEQALEICQKELGLQHRETAVALEGKGTIYYSLGRYQEAEELLQKALAIHEHIEGAELEKAVALNNLANLCQVQGKYKEAEALFQKALALHECMEGAELEKAIVLSNLANLYQMRGKYREAEQLLQKALTIHEHVAETGLEQASTLNNFASSYQLQRKYKQAEELLQQALSIQEKALGLERPSTLAALRSSADLYQAQGKYKEAEQLYLQTLRIQEKTLGPEHPHTGGILYGLANLYQTQGRHEEAEQIYQRALAIQEQALGLEHPEVVGILQGLANLYQGQGKYEEAEQLYQRVLTIQEKALGPEYPDVVGVLQGLADLYQEQEEYEEAEQLYQRALAIQEKVWGPEHPNTGAILFGLANLYQARKNYEEAEQFYWHALAIQEKALGPEHPVIVGILQGLANLYHAQGKDEDAEQLYRRVLSIHEQTWGPEHAYTGGTLHWLASLCQAQGKYEEAEQLYQRALNIREQASGTEHPDIVGILQELANLYQGQGKHKEAEQLYQRVLSIQEQTLGQEHIDVAFTLYVLANLCQAQSQYQGAILLYQRSFNIVKQVWGPEYPHMHNMLQLQNIADFHYSQGKYQEASLLYQRAVNFNKPERLRMTVGNDLVPLFDPELGGVMLTLIQEIRDQLVAEEGFILPPVRIQDDPELEGIEYVFMVEEQTILRKKVYAAFALLQDNNDFPAVAGIETAEPGYDTPVLWVTENLADAPEKVGKAVLRSTDIICSNLKKTFIENQQLILA